MEHIVRKVYCGANRIISSLGTTTAENYRGVDSYATNISRQYDTPVCGIDKGSLDLTGLEDYTFAEQLSIAAIADVADRSAAKLDDPKTLLIISTTKGNIDHINDDFERSHLWALSDKLEMYFKCANKPVIVSNACVSGVAAVAMAARFIEQELYDNVYALGVDVLSEFVISGFNSFKSISPTICKPYDASRDGLTLGEGCAVLLLSADRGQSESGIVVSGSGMSDDANHISGPSRTGEGLFFAIDTAMRRAEISASDISFVNAHGTGTPFNDEMESKALNMASLISVPCNSLKPYIGHTLGASGVIEIILSVEQLHKNRIFGVKGYSESGVPFEMNVSAEHRNSELYHCLKTASGFGGTNAAVVLSKESATKPKYCNAEYVETIEIAHAEIVKGNIPFAEYIRAEYKVLADANLKFFKMDDLSKLAYVGSCKLLKDMPLPYHPNRVGIVMANRSSSLDTDIAHQRIVDQRLPEGTSPAVFVYTLANIAAAEIAIKHKFQGELMMFVTENKNMEFLAAYSRRLIAEDICDAVVYGWCELLGEDYGLELKLIKRR